MYDYHTLILNWFQPILDPYPSKPSQVDNRHHIKGAQNNTVMFMQAAVCYASLAYSMHEFPIRSTFTVHFLSAEFFSQLSHQLFSSFHILIKVTRNFLANRNLYNSHI